MQWDSGAGLSNEDAMINLLIVLVTVGAGALLLYPRLANAPLWRAAITPLASIIGSGFLVLGPILDTSFGRYAPLIMALLCLVAYAFGAAIRFNITRLDTATAPRSNSEEHLETLASWALAFAYVISVAYYLNLLGAFAVSLTDVSNTIYAKLITSGVFALVLIVGWTRGFHALERMEQISVGVKLAIIIGLLSGMLWFFVQKASAGDLVANPATVTGWPALALVAGLLVTVQGFETARYLGQTYAADLRVRAMRLAQAVSTVIYLIYILLLSYVFNPGTLALSETAIVDMMAIVAPILPLLLIAAAISAQFSAAVADTGGSGGLIHELTKGRVSARAGYAVLVAVGVILTWTSGVFDIISYASRAFALYYGLQAMIAARGACFVTGGRWKALLFLMLGCAGIAIAAIGTSVESG